MSHPVVDEGPVHGAALEPRGEEVQRAAGELSREGTQRGQAAGTQPDPEVHQAGLAGAGRQAGGQAGGHGEECQGVAGGAGEVSTGQARLG